MTITVENPYAAPSGDAPDDDAPTVGAKTGLPRRGRRRAEVEAPRRSVRPRAPLPPRPPAPPWVAVVQPALLTLAVLAVWFLVQVLALSGLEQSRAQQVLHAELRQQLAQMKAPTGGAIEPGVPVALLKIPTLGLEQVVVEGTSPGDLMSGPGHLRKTVLPGQEGRAIIYGRAVSYGGPFRSVPRLREGDGITVTTGQGEFTYRVDGVRRDGDPLPVPPEAGVGQLVLVTAEGSGPLAAIAPSRTVYVDATLVGTPAGVPAGHPTAVPDAERALQGDPSVLPTLAFALQGLLVAAVCATWMARRYPRTLVWLLAGPVIVALAWLTSDAGVQLLPNLL